MKRTPPPRTKRVRFHLTAKPGSQISLCGSFNHWDVRANMMVDRTGHGDYRAAVILPRGQHEYKFVVNGQYRPDPDCPRWAINQFGTLNSILVVA